VFPAVKAMKTVSPVPPNRFALSAKVTMNILLMPIINVRLVQINKAVFIAQLRDVLNVFQITSSKKQCAQSVVH
jgi:hypothetical protein